MEPEGQLALPAWVEGPMAANPPEALPELEEGAAFWEGWGSQAPRLLCLQKAFLQIWNRI
jgi:hypothetical protein